MRVQQYQWNEHWVCIPDTLRLEGVGRTHGVAVSNDGRVYIFRQGRPSILVCDSRGNIVESWGEHPGAHGLTLVREGDQEFLWITDEKRCDVEKLTLNGTSVFGIPPPPYAAHEAYVPTWVAVYEFRHGGNGDIWVADGYGSSRVTRYDAEGKFLQTLDGEEGCGRFDCPHGIYFDIRRNPGQLYIADRGNHRVQVYSENGVFLRSLGEDFLTSPDGFAVHGDRLIIPELHGRITVLDALDKLITYLGANEEVCQEPEWPDGTSLKYGKFNSPHAAAVDPSGNIYVVEWRIGGRVVRLESSIAQNG